MAVGVGLRTGSFEKQMGRRRLGRRKGGGEVLLGSENHVVARKAQVVGKAAGLKLQESTPTTALAVVAPVAVYGSGLPDTPWRLASRRLSSSLPSRSLQWSPRCGEGCREDIECTNIWSDQ